MSTPHFHLDIATDQDAAVVRLNLRDDAGRHLDAHAVRLGDHPPALWEGLFDTRAHVDRYAGGTRFTDKPESSARRGGLDPRHLTPLSPWERGWG